MADPLEGMTVAILATTGVEQVELTHPRDALDATGARPLVVSPQSDSIEAWDIDDWGDRISVDVDLGDTDPADFDALVLPGGVLNPDQLRMDEDAVAFVRSFFDADKPVAAICHGPWLLIEAGVVEGRNLTSYASIRTDLRNAGADVVDEEVVTDGSLVTSRNPDDLPAFNDAMLSLFSEARKERSAVH